MAPRVRFAPSPSGYLHIGGARTALFNWLWARRQGGSFVLRVEDTDRERSTPESVRAVLDALKWLGLTWDEGPEVGGDFGPYFQSERQDRYRAIAEQLIAEGKAYRCDVTKEELDRLRTDFEKTNAKKKFVYRGPLHDREVDKDRPHVIRFRAPLSGTTDFVDKVFGPISTPNNTQMDFVIMRSDGMPLYNFAAVVDDHAMGITLVSRGREHIGSTTPQLLLYRALGWEPPEFAHLPIILSPQGEKLSKRHAAVSVHEYRDRGYTPMGVLNYLVRFGWSYGDREIFSRDELIEVFGWDRVGKSDGRFDEKKFADVAFEQLKRPELTSPEDYADRVTPFLEQRGLEVDRSRLADAIPTVRERARTLVDAAEQLDFFFREPPEFDDAIRKKFLTPAAVPYLEAFRARCAQTVDFTATELETTIKQWLESEGLKMKDIAQPARVALTGRKVSPGLFEVMVALGRDMVLARIDRAIDMAQSG